MYMCMYVHYIYIYIYMSVCVCALSCLFMCFVKSIHAYLYLSNHSDMQI